MDVLVWLIAYVIGFGLLQLLLYRYFQRDDPSPETTPSAVEQSAPVAVDAPDGDADGRHCREWGTYNEHNSMFVYCRECASRLQ